MRRLARDVAAFTSLTLAGSEFRSPANIGVGDCLVAWRKLGGNIGILDELCSLTGVSLERGRQRYIVALQYFMLA